MKYCCLKLKKKLDTITRWICSTYAT